MSGFKVVDFVTTTDSTETTITITLRDWQPVGKPRVPCTLPTDAQLTLLDWLDLAVVADEMRRRVISAAGRNTSPA